MAGWSNLVEAAGGWDRVVLANARNDENAKFNGKSLAVIAKEWNKEPADAAFDLVAQGHGRVMAIYHMMTEPDVETALRFPVDQHRQRRGRLGDRGRTGSDGPHASARVRQLSARDRALRARARRALADGGRAQDDVMAGHAHAARPVAARFAKDSGPTSSSSTTTRFRIARPTTSRASRPTASTTCS